MKLSFKRLLKKYHEYNDLTKSLLVVVPLVLIYEILVLLLIGLNHPIWGDERHFYEAILYFRDLDLTKVVDYKEVTPPLAYIIYVLWGKLAGFDLSSLRILSIIVSATNCFLLYYLISSFTKNKPLSILGLFVLMINPYFFGMSVFIFTDMLMILFVLLLFIAIINESKILILFSSCCALLIRQYSIVFLLAAIMYYFLNYLKVREKKNIYNTILLIISVIPLMGLFYFWKGISPPSGLEYWVGHNPIQFNVNALVTYITMIPIYSLPLFIIDILKNKKSLFFYILLFLVGLVYFFFKVRPSEVTLQQTDLHTVGIIHKLFVELFSIGFIQHIIFYLFFVGGLGFIYLLLEKILVELQAKRINYNLFIELTIPLFLIIMPFSYQLWEKYLLILLPSIVISLLLMINGKVRNVS